MYVTTVSDWVFVQTYLQSHWNFRSQAGNNMKQRQQADVTFVWKLEEEETQK